MLRELTLRNLAVVEDATYAFGPGLNCITGQTGAGKSLVVRALEVLFGLRRSSGMSRDREREATIEAVFETPVALAVRRTILPSGRSSATVDGRTARPGELRELANRLLEIHGERSPFLDRPHEVLDRFAGCADLRERYEDDRQRWRTALARRRTLDDEAGIRRGRLDLLEFQAGEIDQVSPSVAECAELEAKRRVLGHLERLRQGAGRAHDELYEAEGAIVERLGALLGILRELAAIDAELVGLSDDVAGAHAQLRDAGYALGSYLEGLDHDPLELDRVEERLDALDGLVAKYAPNGRGGTIEAVLEIRAGIDREIERLRDEDRALESIEAEIEPLARRIEGLGQSLRTGRREAANRLCRAIEGELDELGLTGSRIEISVEDLERVDLLVRTNPDQALRPMDEVASGGERARLHLALRSILAGSEGVGTLVFDEIDAAIGGRLGAVVGRKLRRLAAERQVILVTHLPQIAAFADRQLRVEKRVEGAVTRTRVQAVEGDERVQELAEMIGGPEVTATSRRQALELLERAQSA